MTSCDSGPLCLSPLIITALGGFYQDPHNPPACRQNLGLFFEFLALISIFLFIMDFFCMYFHLFSDHTPWQKDLSSPTRD